MPTRKPSRRPVSAKYKKARQRPRPVGTMGGGQGGFMGGPSSGGLQ